MEANMAWPGPTADVTAEEPMGSICCDGGKAPADTLRCAPNAAVAARPAATGTG